MTLRTTIGPIRGIQDAPSLWRGLRVGLLTEITNPKGIAFFLGLRSHSMRAEPNDGLRAALRDAGELRG